ncbi:MAG: hypothetical protein VB084_16930 [Syntrophomonadaceae bacterium]|nr:hypothetical protein [Syntrophomonadaceae bacterium]
MSAQTIAWSVIVLPWLTLFLMKKEDVKRFLPVALFTVVSSAIIYESGITFNMWSTRETAYPLSQMLPSIYGAFPVLTMWVFKFTYDRFWSYLATNAVLDIVWAYVIFPWFVASGILVFLKSNIYAFILTICHAILVYGYQIWQEDKLVPAVRRIFSPRIQPAATKPSFKNKDEKTE